MGLELKFLFFNYQELAFKWYITRPAGGM